MAKGKIKVRAKTKKAPVKAGSNSTHGGLPTKKLIAIRAKVLADLKKK